MLLRNTYSLRSVLAQILVLSILLGLAPAAEAQAKHYFWNYDEQEDLSLSTERVGINFAPGLSDSERESFLRDQLGVVRDDPVTIIRAQPPLGPIHVVPLRVGGDEAAVLATLKELNRATEIYSAYPVLAAPNQDRFATRTLLRTPQEASESMDWHRARAAARRETVVIAAELTGVSAAAGIYSDGPVEEIITVPDVVLTQKLGVHLVDQAAEEALAEFIDQSDFEVTARMVTFRGEVHLEILVHLDTGFEALELANTFYESGYAVRAEPVLLPSKTVSFDIASPELIAEFEAANAPPVPPEHGHYYYGSEGRINEITFSLDKIGISPAPGVDEAQIDALVASHPDLLPYEDTAGAQEITDATGYHMVRIRAGGTAPARDSFVAELRNDPSIDAAYTVFSTVPGKDHLLTDALYVSFSVDTPRTEIEALIEQHALVISSIKDWSTLGVIAFRLRVTEESGLNALDMANLLYQHPLTLDSQPTPVPLYPAIATAPNDTYYDDQWALEESGDNDIDWLAVWNEFGAVSGFGTGITIAIVDSGVDLDHDDLQDKLVDGTKWHYVDGEVVQDDSTGAENDEFGHGTLVAGIAGAETNDTTARGVAGVAWAAKIMPVKNTQGTGGSVAVEVGAKSIRWAVDNGADVINCSWGYYYDYSAINAAITYARANGVVLTQAAGNAGSSSMIYAARHRYAIAVGATDDTDSHWSDSDKGPTLDLAAPGVDTYTTDIEGAVGCSGGDYCNTEEGTSLAAPHVAGLAALLLSVDPDLSPAEVQAIMQFSADDIETAGRDNKTGHGRINAAAAIDLTQLNRFTICDGNGDHVVSFDSDGNFVLKRNLTENYSGSLSPYGGPDFQVKDGSANPATIEAIVNGASGDMVIKGTLYTEQGTVNPGDDALRIKNSAGTTVAAIDASGNIYLKGKAFIGYDPD